MIKFQKLPKQLLWVTLLSFLLLWQTAAAQFGYGSFGRNKIQYTHFKWQILKTEHFDIYYYQDMEELARIGAQFAEESYTALQPKFNSSVNRRIPLIFFSSHLHFQQTNVTRGFISEGVGGFFEFIKGRVVIPSNGDLHKFRHVIRHELVHVFMHNKIYKSHKKNGQLNGLFPPLWFTEGLAEHWSTKWDSQAEMILKDAVLNNYEIGLTNIGRYTGTFTMYKTGQHILDYIEEKYGDDKILQIMENVWKHSRFEEAFREAVGLNFAEFDHEYIYHLKKKFYPQLAEQDFNIQTSKTIVRQGFNLKPAYWHDGKHPYVVFLGNRTGHASIFMKRMETASIEEEEEVEVLVKGQNTNAFENFHVFDSKIDVDKNGTLAFTAKSGEVDLLYLYNIPKREIESQHKFKNIVALYSPSISPDGNQIAFSGLSTKGFKDIYIYDKQKNSLTQLTNDMYHDADPSWSPDGTKLVFSSDRTAHGQQGSHNLFIIEKNGNNLHYLTFGNWQDKAPVFTNDGRFVAFTSDRNGTFDLYLAAIEDVKEGRYPIMRLSHSVGTIFDPEWTEDGNLLFSTFEDQRFHIRLMENTATRVSESKPQSLAKMVASADIWKHKMLQSEHIVSNKPYTKEYNLDIVQTQVSQNPIFGTTGGAQIAFSDQMGNDHYNVLIYNNSRTTKDFLKSFNFAATKYALGRHVNYGYGLFRLSGFYFNIDDQFYYEDRIGGLYTVSYPFNMFQRLDFTQTFSYSDKERGFTERRFSYLSSSYISFVHDNAIWLNTGPIEGMRINIALGNTFDFTFNNVNYITGLADIRYYHRLGLRTAYAIRGFSLFTQGKESRQFYFGGSWDLRGYPLWSLRGRRIFLVSQELRFPLMDIVGFQVSDFSLVLGGIRGALFVDVGKAWNDAFKDPDGSFGVGIRVPLGYMALRWDIGKRTDFKSIQNGLFTQFFFGWDF